MSRSRSSQEPTEPVEAPATDAPVEATAASSGADPEAVVRRWVAGHLLGGPIAQNTECWNALQAALPSLINQLKEG